MKKTFTVLAALLVAIFISALSCCPRAEASDTGISNPDTHAAFSAEQVQKYVTSLPKANAIALAKEVVTENLRGQELARLNNAINPDNPVPLEQWTRADIRMLFEFLMRMLSDIIGNLPPL